MSDPVTTTTTSLRYIQAVQAAMRWALESRADTLIFGEDVAKPGGPFGATKGLFEAFGEERIFDTAISETAMLGMALGTAMTGHRPIVEIMYADFMFVAMDQLVNQIANTRYVSEGRWSAPLVVRTQQGVSPGACAQHSHSIETYLVHTPGLRVALPATADDAYQMNRTAIDSDDPVIVVEARMLYPSVGDVALDAPVQPMGGARIARPGSDATLVSWSTGVPTCLVAAEQLAGEGVDVEVVDMRWLNPLDIDTAVASIAKTGRAAVVHEANLTGGLGGEIVARASEALFGVLQAPILRVATPDVPMPAAPNLQAAAIPDAARVASTVRRLLGRT
jgi:pyruvate dehydrogenase E1 component beta subunit/2-oxoisovalerate dehydrogenase E1 component